MTEQVCLVRSELLHTHLAQANMRFKYSYYMPECLASAADTADS